jgi:hypothetical protein
LYPVLEPASSISSSLALDSGLTGMAAMNDVSILTTAGRD